MRSFPVLPAPQLRNARQQLIEHGIGPGEDIDQRVARSWQRSLAAGLSPIGRLHCNDNVAGIALGRLRTLNHELISHSEPVMEYLFEQVRRSHSRDTAARHATMGTKLNASAPSARSLLSRW